MIRLGVFWLALLLIKTHFKKVESHGFLSAPGQARNVYRGHTCSHCANGAGVCGEGGQWHGTAEASNLNGAYTTTPLEIKAGEIIDFKVQIAVPHKGHFVMELCRPTGFRITEDCFTHRLKRDSSDRRFSPYIASAPEIFIFETNDCVQREPQYARYIIPPDFGNCDHCIIRWYWQTGNSCASHPAQSSDIPPEVASWERNGCSIAKSTSLTSCGVDCPNPRCRFEQFKNCLDVKVIASSGDKTNLPSHPQEQPQQPEQPGQSEEVFCNLDYDLARRLFVVGMEVDVVAAQRLGHAPNGLKCMMEIEWSRELQRMSQQLVQTALHS